MGAGDISSSIKNSAVSNSGTLAFILAILLWIIDFSGSSVSFTGLIILKDSSFYATILKAFFSATIPLIVGIAALMSLTSNLKDKSQIILNIFFAIMVVFFGWYGGPRTYLHLIFPMFIMWSLPESFIPGEERTKRLMALYLLDFLLPFVASAYLPKEYSVVFGNSLVIPVWVIFASWAAYKLSNSFFYMFMLIVIIFMSVFNFMTSFNSYNLSKNNINEVRSGFFNVASKSWETAKTIFNQATSGFTQMFNQSYYDGTPEKTEKPQGLYLKEMDRGDIEFRSDYPVYLWARLEANTLDQEIEAKVICYTEIEDDFGTRVIKGVVDEDSKSTELSLSVINGVERSIPCIFEELPEGSYDVYYNATFTFTVEASKRVYLMDRQRLLDDLELLAKKGQEATLENVLSVLYDKKDTDPVSYYTSGPVSVGIGTDKVPWDIGDRNNIKPLFGVSIKNMWTQGGKIAHINGIFLKIPDSFSFSSLDRSCTFPIISTSEETEIGYNVYKVKENSGFDEVDGYVSVDCHMTIDPARSLDPLPYTTRSLKTKVDYTYLMQEEISIDVKPGFASADAEGIIARSRLCCEISKNDVKSYLIVDSDKECSNNQGEGNFARVVDNEMCQNE